MNCSQKKTNWRIFFAYNQSPSFRRVATNPGSSSLAVAHDTSFRWFFTNPFFCKNRRFFVKWEIFKPPRLGEKGENSEKKNEKPSPRIIYT